MPHASLGLDLSDRELKFTGALAALALALVAAGLFSRALQTGALRTGFAAGALASVAFWWLHLDLDPVSLEFAAAAGALGLLGLLRWPLWRLAATLLLAGAFGWHAVARPLRAAPRVLLDPASAEQVAQGTSSDAPDVVLIVLDTVRASRLAPYGHPRLTTPNLDAFARHHAVRYTNARSTSSWTLPSHASLFTGLMPAQHGATHPRAGADPEHTVESAALPAQPLRPDVPTLASILRARGYRTGAVLANSAYLDPLFGLARGFEHYDARPGGFVRQYLPLAQLAGGPLRAGHLLYRDAKTITDLALDWIDATDGRPLFLALNYMDAHSPCLPPPPFDTLFGPPAREPLELLAHERRDQYDRALVYLDSELARLLERLERDDALVVITSDHGEALGDHGYWSHSWVLYDPVVKVPLYVKPLGPRAAEEVAAPVTSADVFHLVLGELGIPVEPAPRDPGLVAEWYQVEHVPTSPVLADKHVARDLLAWIEGQRKVIVASTGEVEVYDLALDPGERTPLAIGDDERQALLERARAWWAANPPPVWERAEVLDADDLERLHQLGY